MPPLNSAFPRGTGTQPPPALAILVVCCRRALSPLLPPPLLPLSLVLTTLLAVSGFFPSAAVSLQAIHWQKYITDGLPVSDTEVSSRRWHVYDSIAFVEYLYFVCVCVGGWRVYNTIADVDCVYCVCVCVGGAFAIPLPNYLRLFCVRCCWVRWRLVGFSGGRNTVEPRRFAVFDVIRVV